jgi:hypothetical protein
MSYVSDFPRDVRDGMKSLVQTVQVSTVYRRRRSRSVGTDRYPMPRYVSMSLRLQLSYNIFR